MVVLGFSLAALIGLALGLLGGGGSILTVPILVYALRFPTKQAIAMGLAIVGATSLVGAVGHWRKGNVRLRAGLLFSAVATVGTYAGARAAAFIPAAVQLVVFAVVMLVAAVFMHRNSRTRARGGREQGAEPPEPTRAGVTVLAVAAIGVGLLTGIAGVGGGFLIVPALVLLAGVPMRQAVGTSLLVIALNSFVGFAGYLGHVEVPWAYLSLFTAVAMAGIILGTWLSRAVSQEALKRAFSAFLVVMGVFILAKNREVFSMHPATVTAQTASLPSTE